MTARSHIRSPSARVLDRTKKTAKCWLYQGPLDRDGYGIVSAPSSKAKRGWGSTRVHRAVYEALVGPIPEGLTLDHKCKVRHCVRPDHLEPCTAGENVMRGGSLQAQYAARAHCKSGHPFSGQNVFIRANGQGRGCRACQKIGHHKWLSKQQKEAARNG